jgi:hypothetical protein
MAKLSIAMSVVITLGIISHSVRSQAAEQSGVDIFAEEPTSDFTGTYASEPPAPNCAITTTSAAPIESGMHAIHIDQSGNVMTMRNTPAQNVRILYIQSRRHALEPLTPMRNGLARWDGDAIVVASRMPALPLWSHRRSPRLEGALFERFSVTDGIHFTYRAWYEPTGEFSETAPFEVTLTKCARVLLDASDRR